MTVERQIRSLPNHSCITNVSCGRQCERGEHGQPSHCLDLRNLCPLTFPIFTSVVRRVPPRFSIPPTNAEVMPGGSVNLTCVAVGAPMPYVKWVSGEEELTQEEEMPIGRNVLELTSIQRSANYTCVATSSLGLIETTAQVTVKGQKHLVFGLESL